MARSSIAFLAGLGTGYLNQTEKDKDRERQAKVDQITFDRADRETEQYNKDKTDKANLAAAFKPATVNDQAATLDTSGAPVLYQNADVAQSDYRQARMLAEDGTPDAAPATINAPKPSFAAAGLPYTDRTSAQAGADAYNKPEAQTQRVITALGGVDPLKAMDLDHQQVQRGRETTTYNQNQTAYAKKLGDEGVIDGLKALRNGDGAGMKAEFNKSGQYKIDGEPVLTPEQRTVPGLGDITTYNATFNVVGPDGKTTSKTINSHDTSMSLMSYEKQMDLGIKGSEADSKAALQADQGSYYRKNGDAVLQKADNSNSQKKMPEVDSIKLKAIDTEHARLAADLTKQQSDPMFDPAKPSAAVSSIKTRMGALQMQSDAIIARNSTDVDPVAADPLGVRKPAVNKPLINANSALAPGAAKEGQVDILNQEWEKAHVRLGAAKKLEDQNRAAIDIKNLKKEFSNLKRQPPYATPANLLVPRAADDAPAAAPAPAPVAVPARASQAAAQNTSERSTSAAFARRTSNPSTATQVATNIANIMGAGSAGMPKMTPEQNAQISAELETLKRRNETED